MTPLTDPQVELLSAYLDDEATPAEARQAEALVASSEAARAWLTSATKERGWLRAALPTAVADGEALAGNRRRILAGLPTPEPSWGEWLRAAFRPRPWVRVGAPVFAAALVVLLLRPPAQGPAGDPGAPGAPATPPLLAQAETFQAPARAEVTQAPEDSFVVAMHLEEVDVDVIWIQN